MYELQKLLLFYMALPCDMEPPTYSSQPSPWIESPKVFRQFQSCPIWENGPPFARWQHIWCPCLLLYLPPGHSHQCWPGADWCTAPSCSKSLRWEWSCLSAGHKGWNHWSHWGTDWHLFMKHHQNTKPLREPRTTRRNQLLIILDHRRSTW